MPWPNLLIVAAFRQQFSVDDDAGVYGVEVRYLGIEHIVFFALARVKPDINSDRFVACRTINRGRFVGGRGIAGAVQAPAKSTTTATRMR